MRDGHRNRRGPTQTVRERAYSKLDLAPTATPEQVVLDELERDELWQVVLATAACEQERVVLVESFQLDLPPRTIPGPPPRSVRHRSARSTWPNATCLAG